MAAKILITEDEPNIVESLTFILKRAGYDVAAVTDGEAAMQQLRADPPDVMILDLMLPKLNGFEVLTGVRHLTPIFAPFRKVTPVPARV